jgi:proline utilization trans-activator
MPAAEREHRNRVWWTVHYLERLCSSKHGHPMMLRDEDINTSLPSWEGLSETEKMEFPNPSILISQLQLAKIVGFISRDMYVVSWSPQGQTFLQTVHGIFTRLKNWNEGLPVECKMGSSVPVSRAISSLHLLFNQASHLNMFLSA